MATVKVKLFGVLKVDTGFEPTLIDADTVDGIFGALNGKILSIYNEKVKENPSLTAPEKLGFKDVLVFVNGERCGKKRTKLNKGDEVWILSPASGG